MYDDDTMVSILNKIGMDNKKGTRGTTQEADVTLFMTKDYTKFVSPGWQRPINLNRVERMSKHPNACEKLLGFAPAITHRIQVDGVDKFVVLDGQFRIASAIYRDDWVYYIVDENRVLTPEDIAIMNQEQSTWTIEEWVMFYVYFDREPYIYLSELCNRTGIAPGVFTHLFSVTKDTVKKGRFSPGRKDRTYVQEFLTDWERIISHIDPGSGNDFRVQQRFVRAIFECWRDPRFDTERLISRLQSGQEVRRQRGRQQYGIHLLKIYNYNTRNRYRIPVYELFDGAH